MYDQENQQADDKNERQYEFDASREPSNRDLWQAKNEVDQMKARVDLHGQMKQQELSFDENNHYKKMNEAKGHIMKAVNEGTITPEEGNTFMLKLQTQIDPYAERLKNSQAASMDAQEKQRTAIAQKQLQEEQAATSFRSLGVDKRIKVKPLNGDNYDDGYIVEHQHKPGEFTVKVVPPTKEVAEKLPPAPKIVPGSVWEEDTARKAAVAEYNKIVDQEHARVRDGEAAPPLQEPEIREANIQQRVDAAYRRHIRRWGSPYGVHHDGTPAARSPELSPTAPGSPQPGASVPTPAVMGPNDGPQQPGFVGTQQPSQQAQQVPVQPDNTMEAERRVNQARREQANARVQQGGTYVPSDPKEMFPEQKIAMDKSAAKIQSIKAVGEADDTPAPLKALADAAASSADWIRATYAKYGADGMPDDVKKEFEVRKAAVDSFDKAYSRHWGEKKIDLLNKYESRARELGYPIGGDKPDLRSIGQAIGEHEQKKPANVDPWYIKKMELLGNVHAALRAAPNNIRRNRHFSLPEVVAAGNALANHDLLKPQ